MGLRRHYALLALFQCAAGLAILPYVALPTVDTRNHGWVTLAAGLWFALAAFSLVAIGRRRFGLVRISLWLTGPVIALHALVTPRLHMQVLDGLELLIAGIFAAFLLPRRAAHVWLGGNSLLYLMAVTLNPTVMGVWVAPLIVLMVVTTVLVVMHLLRQIHHASTHDSLTGALNRYGLSLQVRGVRALDERNGAPTTLAFLDADGFKGYNDTHGHAAGDVLLARTVAVLRENVRASDLVCRLGGDEFVVVFPATTTEEAAAVLARTDPHLPIPLSIGLAEWPDGADLVDAIDVVDELMYRNKRAARR